MKSVALCLALLGSLPAAAGAQTAPAPTTRLTEVTISPQPEGTVIHVKTSRAARYRTELIDTPARLVLDLDDTVYDWRKTPLRVGQDPVKEIRGSQYRKGVARVVMEFTRKTDYEIREAPDGLTITLGRGGRETAAARAATPAVPPAKIPAPAPSTPSATPFPAPAPAPTPAPGGVEAREEAPAAPAPAPRTAVADESRVSPALPPRGADLQPGASVKREPYRVAATIATESVDRGRPAPAARPAPGPVAQAAPTAVAAPAAGQRLISLDFKDADVVNLLRILAAESGRNIVIGEDVKGKMSISLRNVPWELALETILDSRGLQKVEKDDVIRIVSTEQLTKEREAKARVEEAKLKGEAEVRAKVAEAQVKEAEAQIRKLSAEAAQREQDARGPLREETLRLSYADPEEVAKTLQGILGIPAEGQKVQGPGLISGPFPEPPFSQLFAPPGTAPQGAAAPVSVSQDVLTKGLTIRAHKPTNTLFVRLYQADLERVKKLVRESLDIPLPQVKIEARMEILDRNALEQIGIQWGGLAAGTSGSTTLVGQGLQTVTGPGGQTVPIVPGFQQGNVIVIDPTSIRGLNSGSPSLLQNSRSLSLLGGLPVSFQTGLPLGGNLINLPISALPNAGPLPAAGLAFGLIGKKFNINLALQALASTGKTRTLARPEIVTVENNKAVMSLGEEIPYATISSAGTQIQFKEALLKLEVTPTVIKEGDDTKIKMLVVVENNSRGDVVNLGNAGQPPAINRRKAETQVLIREGDRLIIGGVLTAVNQNTVRKVPVFGDIPLLGHLFKQRENFETGRELVVFLTPTVIRPDRPAAAAPPAPAPR